MNNKLCFLLEEGSKVSFSRSAGAELGRRISNAGGGEGGPPQCSAPLPPSHSGGLEGLLKGVEVRAIKSHPLGATHECLGAKVG